MRRVSLVIGTHRLLEEREQQVGLCWKESLKCVNSQYHSRMYKLYSEIETGRCGQRATTTNVALHIGLQDSTTATTKFPVTFSQQWTRHLPVTLDCREQRTRSQLSLHKQQWMTCA